MMTKPIIILGTVYNYTEASEKEDTQLCTADGYCDSYAKKIVIRTDYNENDPIYVEDMDAYIREVKRHEITHAYLSESGLMAMSKDERLVDWFARQFPKMLASFREVGALDDDTE